MKLEPALFIAFLGAFAVFSANLSGFCSIVVQSGIQVPMYKFIKLLLEKVPDCKSDMMVPENVSGNLRADRISYLYPGQNTAAVQQVSLSIKQGSFAVIVGESGSGKSTLGKLLAGLDQPNNGHVFLDDYELNTLDPAALRSNIAMVPQDFRLINGTLYENIIECNNCFGAGCNFCHQSSMYLGRYLRIANEIAYAYWNSVWCLLWWSNTKNCTCSCTCEKAMHINYG